MPGIPAKSLPLLLTGAALLAFLPAPASARDVLERFDFDLTGGRRVDQLDWNIAGNIDGNSPNVRSELTWKNIKSNQVSARGKVIMTNDQVPFAGAIRVGGNYGRIYAGDNRDSDYNGDNRTLEFSRSNNVADSGDLWDGSLGGGLVFFNQARTLSLSPLVGFSTHQQNLTMQQGYQTISDQANAPQQTDLTALGPFAGLDSTFETRWRSVWLGCDLDYIPGPYFDLHGGVEVHGGRYESEANWNLRSDLAHPLSFSQSADKALGIVTNAGIRGGYRNVLLTLDFTYQKWRAKDGESRTYLNDGTTSVTKLNQINWESFGVTGGLTVRF